MTADCSGDYVLIEEPGSGRLFVAEHAGPLSIVDKNKRQAVPYINFNGANGAPGLFPKFAPGGGFVSGLMGFAFDPDYRRNGVIYTIHLEDPALTIDGTPKAGWYCPASTRRGLSQRSQLACPQVVNPSRVRLC